MTVDYDLIILGGAAVGRYAAARAVQQGARVALIEPPHQVPLASEWLHQTLIQLNHSLRRQAWLHQWGYQRKQAEDSADQLDPGESNPFRWGDLQQWAKNHAEVTDISHLPFSLSGLATRGVEVILEAGAFYQQPQLGFSTTRRTLRARRYLLAPATQLRVPQIEGLSSVPWVSLDSLAVQKWETLPERVLVLGNDPRGIVLAQVLNRLGTQVMLITTAHRLLMVADQDMALLLQAQLEAEGVVVLTQTEVTQIRQIGNRIWVQAGNQAIETEVIVLASQPELNLTSLNLEAAGIKWQPRRVMVNRKLQTTHPRIYACGEALGGYPNTALSRYEAEIALQNALFLPIHPVNYRLVPTAVFTDPQFVQIGLTEAQAQSMYGAAVRVVKQSLNTLPKAQVCQDTGSYKLVTLESGEIVGAQCIGTEASEWIGLIAVAMQHSIKLPALARFPHLSPTLAEVIQQAAQNWQTHHRPEWQQELLETWFNFTRGR
jgi:pyruvate/2-oxoglutarate dehydrogenase complex dihydrolipoamide dehydrogenase (E3) component